MRKHLFHIVDPSPWPFLTALSAFFFVTGLAFYMHRIDGGLIFLLTGFFTLLYLAYLWFGDISIEASFLGYHTKVVKRGLRLGFWLFICSEIMLFLGFFWAFLHSALCPSIEFAAIWPPKSIKVIKELEYPLLNTMLLIISGISVTWAHKGVSLGSYRHAIDGLLLTIFLGLIFLILQTYEYYESYFSINNTVYSSSFFMLTGLHGFHVIVGVVFLTVCLKRLLANHFLTTHYLGLVFAIW
jgi:heme/copper-type cytochrome/quinol oxidase subunit 3